MASFQNTKKKDWFPHETGLFFVHGNVFKDGSRNSATFKMELLATIGNGRVYNQWTVIFAYCCSNSTIFTSKIKIGWKWPCLETASDTISWFVDMFYIFLKTAISVLLKFCFISNINYKNETWYHCQFHLLGFLFTEGNINTSTSIFEKLIFKSLFEYTDEHKLLSEHQSAFRANDSCTNQLLSIVNDIYVFRCWSYSWSLRCVSRHVKSFWQRLPWQINP